MVFQHAHRLAKVGSSRMPLPEEARWRTGDEPRSSAGRQEFRGHLTLMGQSRAVRLIWRRRWTPRTWSRRRSWLPAATSLSCGAATRRCCGPGSRGSSGICSRTWRRRYRGTGKRRVSREVACGRGWDETGRDPAANVSELATSPSERAMKHERKMRGCGEAGLPEHYRQVIRWHHEERLTFEAIALRLGISPEPVQVWARCCCGCAKRWVPAMTHDETTPIDADLLEALLSADAAMAAGAGPKGPADEPWMDDCLRLLEMIRPCGVVGRPGRARVVVVLGRFEVVREVGRGGFGVVYLARPGPRPRCGPEGAPARTTDHDPRASTVVMCEAHAAAVLDHPNIVPVYEAGELGPIAYIASAYCEGPSLSTWLKGRQHPVPARTAARLIATIAGAVQHAHDGLSPRPEAQQRPVPNSGRSGHGQGSLGPGPALTDFGLAKLAEEDNDQTHSGLPIGSPPYMAPEQAAGRLRDIGPASDVYALGATLYEVLTGRSHSGVSIVRDGPPGHRRRPNRPPRRRAPTSPATWKRSAFTV